MDEARHRAVAATGQCQAEENVGDRPMARHGPPRARSVRRRGEAQGLQWLCLCLCAFGPFDMVTWRNSY